MLKQKNALKSQCSHLLINLDKGALSKTAFISCKSAKINELFNQFTSAGVSKLWYLTLKRSRFIYFLNKAEKLGNEPVSSASFPVSFVLAPRLNILIADTGTGIDDLIGAEKEIRNCKIGKKQTNKQTMDHC